MGELDPPTPQAIDGLTARERESLRMAAEHRQSKEIARQLSISSETVDKHIANACRKLGVSSRREAARLLMAWERGAQLPVGPAYGPTGMAPGAAVVTESGRLEQAAEGGGGRGGGASDDRPGPPPRAGHRTVPFAGAGDDGPADAGPAVHLGAAGAPTGRPGRVAGPAALAAELVSATRKQAWCKPPEMVLREILLLAATLLDESFLLGSGEETDRTA